MMKRVGILGGTFDPIHIGHLLLAQQAQEAGALDQVIFIPAKIQPFKRNRQITEETHRFEMVQRAIAGNPFFQASKMELERREISYTIYTLRACAESFGSQCEIFFIMGTDSFLEIEKWYQAQSILTEFSLIVGVRPGYKEKELDACVAHIENSYHTHIVRMNNRRIEISSTDIKHKIKEKKSIKYLVPKEVEEYIHDCGLYL